MTGYKKMLKDFGFDQDMMHYLTNLGEVIEYNSNSYYKDQSNIDGLGVFASIPSIKPLNSALFKGLIIKFKDCVAWGAACGATPFGCAISPKKFVIN